LSEPPLLLQDRRTQHVDQLQSGTNHRGTCAREEPLEGLSPLCQNSDDGAKSLDADKLRNALLDSHDRALPHPTKHLSKLRLSLSAHRSQAQERLREGFTEI
jgi:hypothetical protein